MNEIVYVLDINGKPLMPTTMKKANALIRCGKAKVVTKCPLVIKLLVTSGRNVKPVTLGIDTGSDILASAAVCNGRILYSAEVQVRNDVNFRMERRSTARKNRRYRNTRYRQARFLNRKNSIKQGRLPPTMISKIQSHIKEIEYVKSILPVTDLIIETGSFDVQKLKNPNIKGEEYQRGINYEFANRKAYILDRDNYICQHCKGKSKDKKLHVHHIVFKSNGGSNDESNLITVCKTCHTDIHNGNITLSVKGQRKTKAKHATHMNIICSQILNKYKNATETYGYITKENRQMLDLPKTHANDAISIASCGNEIINSCRVFRKKSVPKGDYKQTRGKRSEQKMPTGKIMGFRKFDKVKYNGQIYFIKARMSVGCVDLCDITGTNYNFRPRPKMKNLIRISSRKSIMII